MIDDKKATCYYKYEIEGHEKSDQAELLEKLKHHEFLIVLRQTLAGVIRGREPGYELQTPEHHQTVPSGYLVGPAKIEFSWDIEFERGHGPESIDDYNFYRLDRVPKLKP
ncbi:MULTISPECIES: hypothetical protein [Pseudomonas]|uniref:Uncharacterized protein n=1 Tax=Pseudomonas lactis TaxID=1615674 RepID=A0ABS9FJE2_9PSED|nr:MULTISPECIES: hypothetical protein [Pseudomonas]MCF4971839.1 hypothetical protein [Pseudomonas lactis]MCF5000022.1 hypothetical protein [Pseudomonas lactis]MCF5004911.1 hypothetical protein [Pseudomonas lactis]MCF5011201.1 hypothetical protein [Pseudomonas lactis]MCF5016778.1 hypothetical protein [Pseudomonas lactis]